MGKFEIHFHNQSAFNEIQLKYSSNLAHPSLVCDDDVHVTKYAECDCATKMCIVFSYRRIQLTTPTKASSS